jgi:hypothetical protein
LNTEYGYGFGVKLGIFGLYAAHGLYWTRQEEYWMDTDVAKDTNGMMID